MNLHRTDARSAGSAWLGVFCLLPSTPTSHNFNNHPTYTHPIHRLHLKSHLVTSPSVLMLEPIHHIILDLYHCDQPIVSRVRKASFWQTRDIRKCVSERRIVCPLHMVLYLDISTGITIGKPFLQPCSIPFPVRLQVFRNQFNSQIVNEVFSPLLSKVYSLAITYLLSSPPSQDFLITKMIHCARWICLNFASGARVATSRCFPSSYPLPPTFDSVTHG